MKTRVISTEIWDEDKVFCLNIDTKLLYLVLLTNPYIGQSRFYKINDRQLSTYSGLNVEQIQKCKRDLEEQKMVFFKNGYVCVTGFGFVECFYKGSKNEVAKTRELEKIPDDVLSFFREKLDTLSIPYEYPSDTTINHKSEIINNKLETLNQKDEHSIYSKEFLSFWNSYPNKKGKGAALKAWEKIKGVNKLAEKIVASVEEHKAKDSQWRKDNGQYIPHPATFLNQVRWEDEIEVEKLKEFSVKTY